MSATPLAPGNAQAAPADSRNTGPRTVRSVNSGPGRQREISRAWALAAVLIVMTLAAAVPIGYAVIRWTGVLAQAPEKFTGAVAQIAAAAVTPRITVNQIAVNSIQDLRKENKLVVFTADVTADITRQDGLVSWGMYWGTNVSRVMVTGARVQYVIDLSGLQTSDFIYNPRTNVLTLTLPQPKIDDSMIAIDPARIQTLDLRGGWARFDKQDTRDLAIAQLKPQVLSQASAPFIRELAQSAGIDAAQKLVGPLSSALSREGTLVRVVYRD